MICRVKGCDSVQLKITRELVLEGFEQEELLNTPFPGEVSSISCAICGTLQYVRHNSDPWFKQVPQPVKISETEIDFGEFIFDFVQHQVTSFKNKSVPSPRRVVRNELSKADILAALGEPAPQEAPTQAASEEAEDEFTKKLREAGLIK